MNHAFSLARHVHRAHFHAALVAQHRIARRVRHSRAVVRIGEIGQRRHQDGAGRQRQAPVADREQHTERHAAAGGDAADDDALRGGAEREQLLVGPDAVLVPGGKRMLGREPVEDDARAGVRGRAQARQHRAFHVRQADDVRSAWKVQQHAVGPGASHAQPVGVAVRQRVVVGDLESRRMRRKQPLDRPDLPAQLLDRDVALQQLLDRQTAQQARGRRLPADHRAVYCSRCSASAFAAL